MDSISPQELERLAVLVARTNLLHSDIVAIQSALRAYAALRARESAIEEAFSDAVMHIVGPELHVRVWEEYANQLSLIPTDQQSTVAALREGVLVPQSTVNDLLSVKPDKCPARIRDALYELASIAAAGRAMYAASISAKEGP